MSRHLVQAKHTHSHLTIKEMQAMFVESETEAELFWDKQAKTRLSFHKPYQSILRGSFSSGDIRWFEGGELNASYLCLDRHIARHGNEVAFIWEGNEAHERKTVRYAELLDHVCRLANVLKQRGVRKGDRVCIYMPLLIEAVVGMLACARIGAIHSVVFAGFSAQALAQRLQDCQASCLLTARQSIRGHKTIPLLNTVREALSRCPAINTVVLLQEKEKKQKLEAPYIDWAESTEQMSSFCEPTWVEAEHPLFILYTSGSTGTPKGLVHTTAGYLLYAATTFDYVFDYRPGETYWCSADVGWITGHSYVVYGPLMNAARSVLYAGVPDHPTPARCWEIIDRYHINIFYTSPTMIRALMREGEQPLASTTRDSLRLLGTVGEPINPEVWQWFYEQAGHQKAEIVDTWWQTETGGIMIVPLPGLMAMKPGAAMQPFFGVQAALVDEANNIIAGEGKGRLVIQAPWPGIARTIYGDHARYMDTYFNTVPNVYLTGDGAYRDQEGDYWISGRVDDVLNVSGHRLGSAEIESALVDDPRVAEAAVVGCPHDIKGEGIYAFITLKKGVRADECLKKTLNLHVRKLIGPIANIDQIQWAPDLPKTRSGKIMRRILREICRHGTNYGDTSTLANPEVLESLQKK